MTQRRARFRGKVKGLIVKVFVGARTNQVASLVQRGAVRKRNMGSSIEEFFKKEGIFGDAQAQAVKEVVAWQLGEAMKEKKISKPVFERTRLIRW